jgi:uncharacterized protein YecT (DUF1311 family)
MARRNYVEEILSVRLRNETNPRWGAATLRLLELDVALQKLGELPAGVSKYFPIGIVAVMEAYFRAAIRELVDHGPPYSENAAKFEKDRGLSLDFSIVLAIQGRKITLGELVAHLVPLKSLEDIDRNMSTVLQTSFLDALKGTEDRWAIEVEGAARKPILQNPEEIFDDVKKTFRLRHIYCHEIADSEKPDIAVITKSFDSSSIFLKAADQLMWNLVAPGAPLSQGEMNAKASEDLWNTHAELEAVSKEFLHYLDADEERDFAASQEAWMAFREQDAKSYADRWGKGGTIWRTLYPSHARSLTSLRIEDLKAELGRLRKVRGARHNSRR